MIVENSTLRLTADNGESFIARLTTATAHVIKTGDTTLNGIVIGSHTSGTIEIRDGTNFVAGTLKFGTMTLSAIATTGERFIPFFGARFSQGLIVSVSGTIDISVLYK